MPNCFPERTILCSHQQCVRVPVALYPLQHLLSSLFYFLGVLIGESDITSWFYCAIPEGSWCWAPFWGLVCHTPLFSLTRVCVRQGSTVDNRNSSCYLSAKELWQRASASYKITGIAGGAGPHWASKNDSENNSRNWCLRRAAAFAPVSFTLDIGQLLPQLLTLETCSIS